MKSMLRIAAGLALSACFVVFVACSSLPTLQQQFNALCPVVTADLQTISTSPLLNADQQAKAKTAHDFNVKVCTDGASLNVADVKDFANTLLPAVADIVGSIPGFPQGTAIALAMNTFGPLVLQLAEQIVSAVHTVPAAASAPAATSAPAASQ